MAKPIEVNTYTECTSQIPTGTVITQVPEDDSLPIQIILKLGDKQTILKLDELEAINEAVRDALKEVGWEEKPDESKGKKDPGASPGITSKKEPSAGAPK